MSRDAVGAGGTRVGIASGQRADQLDVTDRLDQVKVEAGFRGAAGLSWRAGAGVSGGRP